jgi:hypothetical protein
MSTNEINICESKCPITCENNCVNNSNTSTDLNGHCSVDQGNLYGKGNKTCSNVLYHGEVTQYENTPDRYQKKEINKFANPQGNNLNAAIPNLDY